jgi:hypothetical protein
MITKEERDQWRREAAWGLGIPAPVSLRMLDAYEDLERTVNLFVENEHKAIDAIVAAGIDTNGTTSVVGAVQAALEHIDTLKLCVDDANAHANCFRLDAAQIEAAAAAMRAVIVRHLEEGGMPLMSARATRDGSQDGPWRCDECGAEHEDLAMVPHVEPCGWALTQAALALDAGKGWVSQEEHAKVHGQVERLTAALTELLACTYEHREARVYRQAVDALADVAKKGGAS